MKLFVTGVAGKLGHDVMNELNKRGYEGVGSDLAPEYSGIQDSTAVTTIPCCQDTTGWSSLYRLQIWFLAASPVRCGSWLDQ